MPCLTSHKPKQPNHSLPFHLIRVMLKFANNFEALKDMPKCQVDHALQTQVCRFVSDNSLSVNGAAKLLGVNRTTFWRFHDTGVALDNTRARIRKALANREKSDAVRVSDDPVGGGANEHQARHMRQGGLVDRELKQIRKACEGVLTLLNVYEAQQSLTKKV